MWQAVDHSPDLQRILSLDLSPLPEHPALSALERPGCALPLWPLQRRALSEAAHCRGLLAPIPVGGGKTLVTALLPTVLDCARALILTTAAMVRESSRLQDTYRQHYHIRDDIAVMSYGLLSRPEQSGYLEERAPTLIIADECQALSDPDAARTGRFLRYMRAHPEVLFCGLSGSVTRRSLLDYGHLAALALRQGSPLPLRKADLIQWAEALDVRSLRDPGALLALKGPSDRTVRAAYARRLQSTRGVVTDTESAFRGPLQIVQLPRDCPPVAPEIKAALGQLESAWELPDGYPLVMSTEVAGAERALRLGGYYHAAPSTEYSAQAVREYHEARTAYARGVRGWLQRHRRTGLDSPALVHQALLDGRAEVSLLEPLQRAWAPLADMTVPQSEWTWISTDLAEYAADALRSGQVEIVWTAHPAVGAYVARVAGVPYFGAGSEQITEHRGPCVASRRAHGTGRNLQHYARALVLGWPSQGAACEQLIGRHHRPGQTRLVEIYYLAREGPDYRLALRDARYIQETTGAQQKLLLAKEHTI